MRKESLKMSAYIIGPFAVLLFVFGMPLMANDPQESLTEEEKQLFSDNYLVPSPNELFRALENLGERNWKTIVGAIKQDSDKQKKNYKDNLILAMNLGIRVADGFLAVAAEDKDLLGDLAPVIKTISQRLGVKEALIGVGDRIQNYAQEEKWGLLTKELDELQGGVLAEMVRLRNNDAALLGSIAGWLEGMHLVTKSLVESYDTEGSKLLRQSWLVERFLVDLEDVDGSVRQRDLIVDLINDLKQIKLLCDVGKDEPVAKADIQKLYALTSAFTEKVQRRCNKVCQL